MSAEKLTSGNAYTIRFIYFDDPTTCATQPCTGADALGDDPVASFGRMDGVVADGSGAARFSGDFRDLRLSQGSVVWLMIFGHGPANAEDNRARARQLLTPQSPKLGAPGLGAVADGEIGTGVARAVFTLGGDDPLEPLADLKAPTASLVLVVMLCSLCPDAGETRCRRTTR